MWWRVCPNAPRRDPAGQFTTVTVAAPLQRIWRLRGSVRVLKGLGWGEWYAHKCAWLQHSEDCSEMREGSGCPSMTLWTLWVSESRGNSWQRSLRGESLPSLESFIFWRSAHKWAKSADMDRGWVDAAAWQGSPWDGCPLLPTSAPFMPCCGLGHRRKAQLPYVSVWAPS